MNQLSTLSLSNWPGQSLQLDRGTEKLRKMHPRPTVIHGGPCLGEGYLGEWSPEVFLEKQPLSQEQPHIKSFETTGFPTPGSVLLIAACHPQVLRAEALLQAEHKGPRGRNVQK